MSDALERMAQRTWDAHLARSHRQGQHADCLVIDDPMPDWRQRTPPSPAGVARAEGRNVRAMLIDEGALRPGCPILQQRGTKYFGHPIEVCLEQGQLTPEQLRRDHDEAQAAARDLLAEYDCPEVVLERHTIEDQHGRRSELFDVRGLDERSLLGLS